ncbi:MAG: hypothetical protein ABI877_20100 [Gemmatimonadaceae bacterium]
MKQPSRLIAAAAMVAALATVSCSRAQEQPLSVSPDLPAAAATAKVSATDNGNTKIELVVNHLAMPERVAPGATVYVVWVRGNEALDRPQNIGALKVDSDLNGKLTAVTPLLAFELFVTPESMQDVTDPAGKHVLFTTVTKR